MVQLLEFSPSVVQINSWNIIQNVGEYGIWVSDFKNTLDYIITKNNGDLGIQISENDVPNTLNYC